ncbi:unnamed protein product, partial [marine sediment metagenome]
LLVSEQIKNSAGINVSTRMYDRKPTAEAVWLLQ